MAVNNNGLGCLNQLDEGLRLVMFNIHSSFLLPYSLNLVTFNHLAGNNGLGHQTILVENIHLGQGCPTVVVEDMTLKLNFIADLD